MSKVQIEIIKSAKELQEFEPILWAMHKESRYQRYEVSSAKVEDFFKKTYCR